MLECRTCLVCISDMMRWFLLSFLQDLSSNLRINSHTRVQSIDALRSPWLACPSASPHGDEPFAPAVRGAWAWA